MSDYGEGAPPPPPPYGGGPQEGQHGQPQYGQPQYGQPQPSYDTPQPYGSPAPQQPYGAPPPGYGAPPPGYGAPPPGYGAPVPQGYGAPYGTGGATWGVPATMGQRFLARLIDGLIMLVVVGGLGLLFVGGAATQVQMDPVTGEVTSGAGALAGALISYSLIVIAFGLLYEVVLIGLRGATLGKQAIGVKVVRETDGQVPGWGPSALRWLVPQLAGMLCGLSIVVWLSPYFDKSGRFQGWHDKVAKTLVVKR